MEKTEFDIYITERYQPQVSWYDEKSKYNQDWYKWLQLILIILSALTPVIIAMDFCYQDAIYRVLSICSAVLVAIIGSGLKVFKFQENWIDYRTTCETLKKEIYLYRASASEYSDTPDKEALFVERVESLISRENTLWLTRIKSEHEANRHQ